MVHRFLFFWLFLSCVIVHSSCMLRFWNKKTKPLLPEIKYTEGVVVKKRSIDGDRPSQTSQYQAYYAYAFHPVAKKYFPHSPTLLTRLVVKYLALQLPDQRKLPSTVSIRECLLSPDDQWLAILFTTTQLTLWSVERGHCFDRSPSETPTHRLSQFTADGQRLLVIGEMARIYLWTIPTGELVHCFTGHTDILTTAQFSTDERFILSSSWDGTLRLWAITAGTCVRTLVSPAGQVLWAHFWADDRCVLSVGRGAPLCVWDVATGKCVRTLGPRKARYHIELPSRLSASGQYLLTVDYQKTGDGDDVQSSIQVWELSTGECRRHFLFFQQIRSCFFVQKDAWVAMTAKTTFYEDTITVTLWDLETGNKIHHFENYGWCCDRSFWFSSEPKEYLVAIKYNQFVLLHIESRKVHSIIITDGYIDYPPIIKLRVSSNGQFIIVASKRVITFYDLQESLSQPSRIDTFFRIPDSFFD